MRLIADLQTSVTGSGNEHHDEQTKNAGACLETSKNEGSKADHDEQRLPDFGIADAAMNKSRAGFVHLFVDEMKERLVHRSNRSEGAGFRFVTSSDE